MARKFDFDNYKAIVDYITASTGLISTSIDQLIKGTIELRSSSTAAIVKYSTTIKEITIGTLVSIIGEDKWISSAPISLGIDSDTVVVFPSTYEVSEHSMLPTTLPDGAIAYIAESFVKKSNSLVEISRDYDASVTAFSPSEVPSVSYFKANYIQKDEAVLFGKVVSSSSVISENNDGVSISMANSISGAKILEQDINVETGEIDSNLFIGAAGAISFVATVSDLNISSGTALSMAPSDNSVVTNSNISKVAVKTDLSNLDIVIMQAGVDNSDNILTDQAARSLIVEAEGIAEMSADIKKTTSPQYTTPRLHPNMLPENNAYGDSENISRLEATLLGEKDNMDADRVAVVYGELFGSVPITPGLSIIGDEESVIAQLLTYSNGRLGSSLKIIYEAVAVRLLLDNKELFMDESEYQSISGIQSTLMKDADTIDFMRRPMLLASGEVLAVSGVSFKINSMTADPSSSQIVGW